MPKDRIYFASLPTCNEDCLFCVRGGKAKPIKYLNTEESKKWILRAAKERWKTLIFDGGEPTLRSDLPELIDFAQKSGFKNISILTNGLRLADEEFVKELAKVVRGNNQETKLSFCFSLHSHRKEISEYLVNTPNTFEKTLEGIRNSIKLGIPVSIYHIITTYNYEDLPAFVDFLHTNFPSIGELTFSFIYPSGAALENKHLFPRLSKLEPYLYEAMAKAKKYDVDFSISTCGTIPLCYLKGYEIYTVNQQRMDQPENVGLIDSGQELLSQLATKQFHKQSKTKDQKCDLCLLNKLCGGLWKVYGEMYGLDELEPVVDKAAYKMVMVDLENLEEIKRELVGFREIFFVDFKINGEFNKQKFEKIIDFVKWLKLHNLNYLVLRPIPCFLDSCEPLYNSLDIPQNCKQCLNLFEVVEGKVYFCNGAEGKTLKEYYNRGKLFADFLKSRGDKKNEHYKECYFRNFSNKNKRVSPYIYIGYQCNNDCTYCSEADEYMENLEPKTLNQIKEEVRKTRAKYDFINFMGREPTLRKDFIDILKFTKTLNFQQVGFTTNGRLLAYLSFTRAVLKTGVNQIVISLNGATAKTHDQLTRVPGSFAQTITGIKNVMRFKNPEVSVIANFPLNKLNYFELKLAIDLVKDLGIREINILHIAPLSRRSRTKKIVMKMSELGEYVVKVLKEYKSNPNLKFLLVEFPPCSLPKEAREYFFPCLEKNPEKVRIPLCKNCLYKKECDGVLQDYINLYGTEEFKL